MTVNRVILVGNLGADPETRYLSNGDAVTNIRLATSERYKDKASGQQKETTEWHRVNFFGKLAEIAGKYLVKGATVYIEGKIRTRKWQDSNGQDKYSTEIVADQMKMLGGRQDDGEQEQGQRQPQRQPARNNGGSDFTDDQIPFNRLDSRLPL